MGRVGAWTQLVLVTLAGQCLLANGLKLDVTKDRECVTEMITDYVRVSLVSMATNHKTLIDFQVTDAEGAEIFARYRLYDEEFEVPTKHPGMHKFCVNVNNKSPHKSFQAPQPVSIDITEGSPSVGDALHLDHIDALMGEMTELLRNVHRLNAEVKYISLREQRHRKTTDHIQGRVLMYAVIKALAYSALAVVQVLTIRYFFKDDGYVGTSRNARRSTF